MTKYTKGRRPDQARRARDKRDTERGFSPRKGAFDASDDADKQRKSDKGRREDAPRNDAFTERSKHSSRHQSRPDSRQDRNGRSDAPRRDERSYGKRFDDRRDSRENDDNRTDRYSRDNRTDKFNSRDDRQNRGRNDKRGDRDNRAGHDNQDNRRDTRQTGQKSREDRFTRNERSPRSDRDNRFSRQEKGSGQRPDQGSERGPDRGAGRSPGQRPGHNTDQRTEKFSDKRPGRFSGKRHDNRSGKLNQHPEGRRAENRRTENRPPESRPGNEPVRLNKAIAAAGICSRRAADTLIQEGNVTVNGEVVDTPGIRVTPGKDSVTVEGKPLVMEAVTSEATYIMLHKPVRTMTTVNDPQGRKTVLDALPENMRNTRLFPVGRLDYFSEGLLIITDDGELTYRLTHPKWHMPKVYFVRISNDMSEQELERRLETMRKGMRLDEGEELAPVEARVLPKRDDDPAIRLELTLGQGINRQIRRMCRDLGITILTLRRVEMGPLKLDIAKGQARYLTREEIRTLKKATGLA